MPISLNHEFKSVKADILRLQSLSVIKISGSRWPLARLWLILFVSIPISGLFAGEATDATGLAPSVPSNSLQLTGREALVQKREIPRHVLVIHGWNSVETEKPPSWPIDTITAYLLQTPMEWLGYEADYLDIGREELPLEPAGKYAAILFDPDVDIPFEKELAAAEWLLKAKEKNIPLLVAGALPFESEDALRLVARGLGLRGSLEAVPKISGATLTKVEHAMVMGETTVQPRQTMFHDLSAPEGAQVLIGLQGRAVDGKLVHYDPLFLASWGGMWLDPYLSFGASANTSLFYADPYKVMAALLGKNGPVPAPDTTTRDGRRLFYSHIDGDGFVTESTLRGRPLCGELVRDRILKKYPFPVTVSVIEAEVRALVEGMDEGDVGKFTAVARSIFALPNVQAATHSFSHPYCWDPADPNPGGYDTPNLTLRSSVGYDHIDPVREIRGSTEYINRDLLPPDKRVELMLWSGNCRPGTVALAACREMGLENMNGGNTIVGRRYPGLSGVAPRVMPWGDDLQLYAANQNEFMYANGWQGPFFGGFADVADTFERTESPRRLKPVNVYYHFYSATSLSALRALEKIHDWCASHELHSVTAVQYARMVRDARRTRIFELGPRHWLLVNQGDLRTFRLPAYLGRPDMARCKGVTGSHVHQDAVYIHTSGQTNTELVLRDEASGPPAVEAAHLHLAWSSAEIEFSELSPMKASFAVRDLRPVEIELAGLWPRAACELTVNSTQNRHTADDHGRIRLSLPAIARVTIDASRSRHAILR